MARPANDQRAEEIYILAQLRSFLYAWICRLTLRVQHAGKHNQYPSRQYHTSKQEDLLIQFGQMKIKNLKLPTRLVHALTREGITMIDDLALLNPHDLFMIKRVGKLGVVEIQNALKQALNAPFDFVEAKRSELQTQSLNTWVEFIEPFLRSEKQIRIYVFLSRFGFNKKTLEALAAELRVSRERVRQIEKRAAERLIAHTGLLHPLRIMDGITAVLAEGKEDLSLTRFKSILTERGLLGDFSEPIQSDLYDPDPFELLIGWLALLSDGRMTTPSMIFPIAIADLRKAVSVSVGEYKALPNKTPQQDKSKRKSGS